MKPKNLLSLSLIISVALLSAANILAQDTPAAATNAAKPVAPKPVDDSPLAPDILPGKGLAQHDFFYAGEGREQRMYIVRQGKVAWSYTHPGKGEISDATMLSNGNILFAHQFGVTEITPDKQVVWNFDAPTNTEIHTAQKIGREHVLFIENGPEPKLVVMNTASGKTETEFPLPVGNLKSTHGQFRHARLTDAGTVIVAHMDMGKVCEYDFSGKELRSIPVPSVWSAVPLQNGNILVASNRRFVREVSPKGETVWEYTPAAAPEYKISGPQIAARLANGNTLINNWYLGKVNPTNAPLQAIEVTPEKKVVWGLRSWADPDLGPSTIIQILDIPNAPENVHFGDIK